MNPMLFAFIVTLRALAAMIGAGYHEEAKRLIQQSIDEYEQKLDS